MVSWVCVGAVVSYAYASGLTAALALPARTRAVDTFAELLRSDYRVAVQRDGFFQTEQVCQYLQYR